MMVEKSVFVVRGILTSLPVGLFSTLSIAIVPALAAIVFLEGAWKGENPKTLTQSIVAI